jgi:hypothetical protein
VPPCGGARAGLKIWTAAAGDVVVAWRLAYSGPAAVTGYTSLPVPGLIFELSLPVWSVLLNHSSILSASMGTSTVTDPATTLRVFYSATRVKAHIGVDAPSVLPVTAGAASRQPLVSILDG